MSTALRSLPFLVGFLTVGCFLGCGDSNPTTYPVTGKVTYKGKPVPNATVGLQSTEPEKRGAVGRTNDQGEFQLTTFVGNDGALPGTYQVVVSAAEPLPDTDPNAPEMTQEEEEAAYEGADNTPVPKSTIPTKYAVAQLSGLTHTVPEGPSTLDIDLED